jgi:hypothetical protein
MNLIQEAVKIFQERIFGSGCEMNAVEFTRNPSAPRCQYEKGVNLEVRFGGRTSYFSTNYPIEAKTLVSHMFEATLSKPQQRTAAAGIMNAVVGFLCLSRKTRPCEETDYAPCYSALEKEIGENAVYFCGPLPRLEEQWTGPRVEDPASADVIFVSMDGMVSDDGLSCVETYRETKRILFIGPETAAICALLDLEHWCPFGR